MLITIDECREEMIKDLTTGQEKGTTTYWEDFDNCWTWRKGEVNVFTGQNNEGKSEFIRQLALIKALSEGKKFIFCSPEDAPPKSWYDNIIHTLSGKTTDIGKFGAITLEEYNKCVDRIGDLMVFLNLTYPDNSVSKVLEIVGEHMKLNDVYGLIIDPIMKFSRDKGAPERDDLYMSHLTAITTEFARKNNICLFIVAHQVTPRKDENGFYPKPSSYQIKNGGSLADGVDNILFVWRPKYAKDKLDTTVTVGSLKIKKQKLVGIPQDLDIMFDRKTNRYTHANGKPIFDFDKYKVK